MTAHKDSAANRRTRRLTVLVLLGMAGMAGAALVPMTLLDFHTPGTQVGDILPGRITTSNECIWCHGNFNPQTEPYANWQGSLMGQAGRDPLFFAQMTTANQDVANVGYYCLRCHVPMSIVTGHANQADGSTLDPIDRDGVTCHLCHSMVDPIFKPGISPPEDELILNVMSELPGFYGNSMFVLDPNGHRRGPLDDATMAPHVTVYSPFHRTSEFCGTCHDVGNLAISKQPDGTFRYNAIDQPSPIQDPHQQFPLERTYTEWKLSAFADGGVDMGGRFGGIGPAVVSTCQDCHMPRTSGQVCYYGPDRPSIPRHDFAGASSWVLDIIAMHYENDPEVDVNLIREGSRKAVEMLERAATLELTQACGTVRTRVINESGHKLPTGHIEGRRVWVNVKVFDAADQLIREYGHYDAEEGELDEATTEVYEMHIGLSEYAAGLLGLQPGATTRMSLADTIVKDNRIPPRGFNNATFEAGGAPVVGTVYADGQYWDDTDFWLPQGAARVEASVFYATVTRHYIEALRDANVTDDWGDILHSLWERTGRCPPVLITTETLVVQPFQRGDFDGNGSVTLSDYAAQVACQTAPGAVLADGCACFDFDGDRDVDLVDYVLLQRVFYP